MIRGAQLVGTPLAALEKIIAGGDQIGVFNGACGRESGHIRNCDASPAILLQSIEIKRSSKTFEKKPILPDPTAPPEAVTAPETVTPAGKVQEPNSVSKHNKGSK